MEAILSRVVFRYNQSRPNENDAEHGCTRPLAMTALAPTQLIHNGFAEDEVGRNCALT